MAKTKAFVDNYLPALLGQAWYLVSTQFHAVVEQHGLSVLEWRVLSTLARDGAMTISSLAQTTVSKQPTVTRLLTRLEAQKYVERSISLDDRRYTWCDSLVQGDVWCPVWLSWPRNTSARFLLLSRQ